MSKRRIILPTQTAKYNLKEGAVSVPAVNPVTAKVIDLGLDFKQQHKFTEDPARFVAAQCSRRAGKTNGLALRFFKTMEKHPRSQCVYLALTKDSAKDIMWPVLLELNDKYQMNCEFKESQLTMIHPNGATLRLYGADMKNFIRKLKGRKFPGIAIDEAQDFGSHLQSLVDDVLTPCLTDYEDSWLAITGTPGPVPKGYFFEITQKKMHGFSYHEWTLLDNPYLPNPEQFLNDLKTKRQWDDNNPTLLREWKNKWILDLESLWIRYKESDNGYEVLPDIKPVKYNYIMGIDIGFKDSDAIAVIAWSPASANVYLVEEVITPKQGITELVSQINELRDKYDIVKMVMDEGGLGKKVAEEIRRRHSIPVHPADKMRKQESVEFLNDYLRLGKFKAKPNSRFVQDSYLIQIDWDKSTPDKIVIKKDPHSDIIDAVLYAFKESPAFTYRAPERKLHPGTKEWAEAQQKQMFEDAMKHFQEQAERERWERGEY